MNKLTLLFFTVSFLASAVPVITGGAITAGSSGAAGQFLNVSLTGPGLNVFYADNRHSFSLPPSCTAPCNFDFTQSVVIGITSANFLVDGTQYNLVAGTLTLSFSSAVLQATPLCAGACGTGQGPSNYLTYWSPTAFTATGTLVLRDPAQLNTPIVYNQSFTATGSGTGVSDFTPPGSLTDSRSVTYTFAAASVPEPAPSHLLGAALAAGLGLTYLRKRG